MKTRFPQFLFALVSVLVLWAVTSPAPPPVYPPTQPGGGGAVSSNGLFLMISTNANSSVSLLHAGIETHYTGMTYPIEVAASNAVAGDVVIFSGPTITTNGVWLKPGVNLEGRGAALLINQNSNTAAVTPSGRFGVVISRNNSVKNVTFTNVYHTLFTAFSVGFDSSVHYGWSPTPTNILIEMNSPNSISDGIFFGATNAMTGIQIRHCNLGAKYDTIVFVNRKTDATSIPFSAEVDGISSYLFPSAVNLGFTRQSGINVNGYMTGTLRVKDSFFFATNNLSTACCISTVAAGDEAGSLAIEVNNCVLSGTNYFQNQDAGPGTIAFNNCNLSGFYTTAGSPFTVTHNSLVNGGSTFVSLTNQHNVAYDATSWNGSLEVPTMDAVRDKIETLSSGSTTVNFGDDEVAMEATGDVASPFTGQSLIYAPDGVGTKVLTWISSKDATTIKSAAENVTITANSAGSFSVNADSDVTIAAAGGNVLVGNVTSVTISDFSGVASMTFSSSSESIVAQASNGFVPTVLTADPASPQPMSIWGRSDIPGWRGFDGTDFGTFTFTPDP